jgi:hypothetical protein
MDLYLRKSDHGQQAPDMYRVILKSDGDEAEIGSISIRHSAGAQYHWKWAIDTVVPMRTHQTQGRGTDRADWQFKRAWEQFSGDEANLTEFMAAKRRARRSRNPP